MISINLNDLIKNYSQNLLKDLRGFGKNNEYLKFWVPGTDNFKSFLNLIDAFVETNTLNFEIELDNFDSDLDKVEVVIKKISKSFFVKKYLNSIFYQLNLDKKKYEKYKKKKIKKNTFKRQESKNIKSVYFYEPIEELLEPYKLNIEKIKCNNYLSRNELKGKNIFKGMINDLSFQIKIEKNIIKEIKHLGSSNQKLERFMNIFADIAIQKSIHETSEHGIIYLEEKIRLIDKKQIKKGIILPHMAGYFFVLLNKEIRKIEKEYNNDNKYVPVVNKSYFQVKSSWKNLSFENKKNKIMEIINKNFVQKNIIQENSIKINKIDLSYRIYFYIDKNFKEIQKKQNILLDLEYKLKKLDNTLEVFVDEIIDQNKLRLKNSPQKI